MPHAVKPALRIGLLEVVCGHTHIRVGVAAAPGSGPPGGPAAILASPGVSRVIRPGWPGDDRSVTLSLVRERMALAAADRCERSEVDQMSLPAQ